MALKRKHRLVIEITVSEPMTEKSAAWALKTVLERHPLGDNPIWAHDDGAYIDKVTVKQFSRVLASEFIKAA